MRKAVGCNKVTFETYQSVTDLKAWPLNACSTFLADQNTTR